jgi:hypothetical protein
MAGEDNARMVVASMVVASMVVACVVVALRFLVRCRRQGGVRGVPVALPAVAVAVAALRPAEHFFEDQVEGHAKRRDAEHDAAVHRRQSPFDAPLRTWSQHTNDDELSSSPRAFVRKHGA